MKKILLVEDDFDLSAVLKHFLEIHNFEVILAENGILALEKIQSQKFDLCILDVMMPELDGFSVAKTLQKNKQNLPFLFLTAKNSQKDKVSGLQLGAEDYITKPFDTEEFLLRIENILKRNSSERKPKKISIASYELDCERLVLHGFGKQYQLTEKEGLLLQYLNTNSNRIIKREEVLQAVWQATDFFSGRSMDVYLSKLRKYFANTSEIKIESTRHLGLEFKINTNLKN